MRNGHFEDKDLEAPPRLVSALRHLPKEPLYVPSTIDETVMRAARRHLIATAPRFNWLLLLRWAGAFAGVTMVILAVLHFTRAPSAATRASFARADLNHDGHVDILDAFVLAKQLKLGGVMEGRLDVNGDGKVDGRDVQAIAAQAVSLEKGGHS